MKQKLLKDLGGEFVQIQGRPDRDVLFFLCPVCDNGHGIMVSWGPPSILEGGAIWKKIGDGIDRITLSPSINCDIKGSGCKFHGFVKDGWVLY